MDREKIVLLTRLAVYDKHLSESDRKINNYFLHDYIYSKNIRTRFFAFTGAFILFAYYAMYRILVLNADVFTLDYKKEITEAAVFFAAIIALYTIIGSIRAAVEYRICQKRIKAYMEVLKKTGEMGVKPKKADIFRAEPKERYNENDGTSIIYKGGNYKHY